MNKVISSIISSVTTLFLLAIVIIIIGGSSSFVVFQNASFFLLSLVAVSTVLGLLIRLRCYAYYVILGGIVSIFGIMAMFVSAINNI